MTNLKVVGYDEMCSLIITNYFEISHSFMKISFIEIDLTFYFLSAVLEIYLI